MSKLGVGARLGVLVATAVVVILALVATMLIGQITLVKGANDMRDIQRAKSLLNHLDTREAELKVDAYRSVIEKGNDDIAKDLPGDLASVTDTLTELRGLTLPTDAATKLEEVERDVFAFNSFVEGYVALAGRDERAARAQEPKVAELNGVVDDKLGAVHEVLDAEIAAVTSGF